MKRSALRVLVEQAVREILAEQEAGFLQQTEKLLMDAERSINTVLQSTQLPKDTRTNEQLQNGLRGLLVARAAISAMKMKNAGYGRSPQQQTAVNVNNSR